jgi:hypothetical protein
MSGLASAFMPEYWTYRAATLGLALLAAGPALAAEVADESASTDAVASDAVSAGVTTDAPPEAGSSEEVPGEPLFSNVRINAQWFWVKDKVMPGIGASAARSWVDLDVELSLLWSTAEATGFDGSFIGMQSGIAISALPLRTERLELGGGIAVDMHFLAGVHVDLVEGAFGPRAFARLYVVENVALYASARAYLIESNGLSLGTERDGSDGLPVLFSSGITGRLP